MNKKFDLDERTATSVGANYSEADCAESKKISSIKLVFVKRNLKNLNIGTV